MSQRFIKRVAIGIVFTFLLFFLVSAKSHAATTLKSYENQKITWSNCSDGFQCGTFTVPVDYANVTVDHFTLRVLRRPTSNSARIGTLFVNPGGPGASAME